MDIMSSVTNPKATWRAAANPPVAENTAQHPLEVVGRLRCLFTRSDHKKRLSGYKKRFWVVNVADGTLDMYKNDQEHVPIIRFKASSLRGVVFSWDKQNRFYVMQLQTRLDYSVVFRMSSFEERELWSNAITKLIERYAAVNRRGNVYAHIVKRCAAAAKHFDVNISVDPSQHVLTDFPEHFLQFVPEAVDAALLVVSTLVSTYKDDTRAPIHYTLDISAQPGREVNPAELGPRYNPEKGGVILNVALFRNASGKVDFYTTSASDVDNLLSSNVFRNPLVEGWIENSRDIRRVCQEIRSLLSTPKTPLTITFEWSGTVSDGSVVEGYLRRHLGQDFFQDILATIYRAINDLQQIVQMELFKDLTLLNKDSSFSNMVAANKPSSSAGRPGSPLHSPRESKSRYAHSRSASANMAAAGPFSPVLMVTGGGANRGSSDAHHAAVSLIAENTSGISILLKSNEVEGDIGPPEVTCTRVYDFYQRNSPGLLLIKYCSEVFSLDMTVDVSLKEDVFLIGYNAFLSVLSTTWRAKFRSMFEKKVTVSIDWKSFLLSIKNEGGVIAAAELPQMMSVVFEALYSRFLHTTQHLSQPFSNDPDENNLLMDNFLNVFYSCVRYIRVVCVTSREKADGYGVTVQDGILTDTWVCSMHDPLTQSMRAGATATSTVATKLKLGNGSSVFISPVCTRLGSWVEQYFSMEANCIATDPASIPFVDEYYYDMNEINDGEEDAIPIDLGDAVALERGAEMGMLNLRRVVNVVYDSQDGCVTDLKVSAELIRTVALHFRKELGMAFHDVQRVLISNLARLRILYSRGADIESREELTYEGAMQLLKDYCEYEESEKLIKGVLPNRARDSNNTSFSTVPDNTYPFKTVCAKSLLHLFPLEFELSRLALRVGLVVGLENTGKTLIINSMKGFCKPTVTTVGLAKQVACFKEWVFALHELGGRDSFRRNWLLYAKRIKQLDFIVFCIDSQDVRSFEDVHTYLKEVASHFKEKPIVVIFNNHRVLPRPITVEHLEECVKMKSVRNVNQHRAIFTCLCDVSVVHPVNSTLPEPLSQAFSQLSEALKENTPKEKLPHTPKPALQIPPGPSPPTPPLRRKNGGHSPGLADSPSGSFSRRLKEENSVARVLADNLESPSPDRNPDTKEAKAAPKVLSPSAEHSLLQRSFTQQHHESHSPFTTNLPTEPSPINEQSTTILYESPRAKDKLPNFPPKGTENDLTLEQPTSTDLSLSGSSIQKTVVESVVCIPTPKR